MTTIPAEDVALLPFSFEVVKEQIPAMGFNGNPIASLRTTDGGALVPEAHRQSVVQMRRVLGERVERSALMPPLGGQESGMESCPCQLKFQYQK